MTKNEKLFEEFLKEYLENVKKKLPDSFRAKQLKAGGLEAGLVYKFETDFLKEPFMKAIEKISQNGKRKRKKKRKDAEPLIEMDDYKMRGGFG